MNQRRGSLNCLPIGGKKKRVSQPITKPQPPTFNNPTNKHAQGLPFPRDKKWGGFPLPFMVWYAFNRSFYGYYLVRANRVLVPCMEGAILLFDEVVRLFRPLRPKCNGHLWCYGFWENQDHLIHLVCLFVIIYFPLSWPPINPVWILPLITGMLPVCTSFMFFFLIFSLSTI